MNVLHFMPVYKPAWRYGGPVRSVSLLCEALSAEGVLVSVLTTNADGDNVLDVVTGEPVEVDGVTVRYFGSLQTPWGIDSPALRKHVNGALKGTDLVHMSAMWQPLAIPVAKSARCLGIPYVYTLRGGINPWAWRNRGIKHHIYWHLFEKQLIRQATALHVTCEQERQEALSLGVGTNQHIIRIPNGILTKNYVPKPKLAMKFRQVIGIGSDRRIILHFGRIHPKKGIDVFLRSAADVLRSSPEWVFVVVGPDQGRHRQELMELVDELGISESVRFAGMVDGDMRLGAYSAADIFVLTSHNENFGMSVVEAMASSVPVLISDQVGIAREIASDQAGLVTKLEPSAIQRGIESLMSNRQLRESYIQRGLACVKKRYEIGVVGRQMIEAYRAILCGSVLDGGGP